MFDFQKLEVYSKSKAFCKETSELLSKKEFDKVTNDQLRRASFSIMLNIAELHISI
jgi:four helix bundle protein